MNIRKKYTKFRKDYKLDMIELEIKDECIYFNGELVEDKDQKYPEGENYLDVGYNLKNSKSKVLSNLFPLNFKMRGKKVSSIEGIMQGIKYKDKKMQNRIFKYFGIDAYHTRACNENDFWGTNGTLYWQGKPIDRHSEAYQIFIDEVFISALKNPIYKRALLSTDKYLLHHIGRDNPNETVLTRYEYELRLNSLRDFIKLNNLNNF